MVLVGEESRDARVAQADADDAPAPVAGLDCGLGVQRLMRAVKRAEAKVDDARAQTTSVVSGLGDRGFSVG